MRNKTISFMVQTIDGINNKHHAIVLQSVPKKSNADTFISVIYKTNGKRVSPTLKWIDSRYCVDAPSEPINQIDKKYFDITNWNILSNEFKG